MKLKKLALHNFRGYKDIEVMFDNSMNVIIGANDVGKSTILEALDIFFNGNTSQTKLDENDLNVLHDEGDTKIRISCSFEIDTLIIDSCVSTNLADEYLLNKDGFLEIVHVSDGGKKISTFLNANYPCEITKPLVQLKISELKALLQSCKESIVNYEEINKTISSEIRLAIYNANKDTYTFAEREIDITKEDAKNIYSSIEKQLPVYFLFKADRENKDGDSEIQSPLKLATKSVIQDLESELNSIKQSIEESIKKIGDKTIEKMKEINPDLANSLTTQVNAKPWESLFSFQLVDENNIPINKRGSGVRRLFLMSYLRAEAERQIESSNKNEIIYAIEEPETAQHPNFQNMIMDSLLMLSNKENHQILITTHTPEIAKMVSIDQIIFLQKKDNLTEVNHDDDAKFLEIKQSLGIHLPFTSKVVVCVEGTNDIDFLKNIAKIEELKRIVDLNSDIVSIIPMRGGTLKEWINRDYLRDSNVKEVHIYDSDVPDYKKEVDKMNAVNDGRRFGFITQRYEMENYIPIKYIRYYKHNDSDSIVQDEEPDFDIDISKDWAKEDIPQYLKHKDFMGFSKKVKTNEIEKAIKGQLNKQIASRITKKDLDEMKVFTEIESWFLKIKEFLDS